MLLPSQRWYFVAIGLILFSILLLGNSFLEPPYKPTFLTHTKPSVHPIWLIATFSPASGFQRRMMIRDTWQKLYRNDSIFTSRFVISNPGDLWAPFIEAENATYGDLIMLPQLEETSHVANTVKSVEFFKHITSGTDRWAFVSKLDDDSYLDAHTFYETFLHPRLVLERANSADVFPSAMNRTIVGRTLHRDKWTYPGGQFYTMSWDMVVLIADLHRANPISDEHEDVLVGRLLHEADEEWHHIDLPSSIAFDYEADEVLDGGSAFAKKNANLDGWSHAVGPGAINPHKLRDDEDYLKVAACFSKDGVMYPA